MKHFMHHVPGRLRVRLPEFKANAAAAREMERSLAALAGVFRVEVNPLTGSVLVHYDQRGETANKIIETLEMAPCTCARPETRQMPDAVPGGIGTRIAKVIALRVIEAAVERAALAAVAALL